MHSQAEKFIQHLTDTIGEYQDIAGIESGNAAGMVLVVSFRDFPEKGLLTGFTYGLSAVSHPEWQESKPELIITVASADLHWTHAIGYLVEWNRQTHSFLPGSLFHYGQPVAADSGMDSFLVFNPVIGTGDEFKQVQLEGEKIHFQGVFPLYHREVALIQKVGIRKFTGLPEYSLFSVNRPDLSTIYQVGG